MKIKSIISIVLASTTIFSGIAFAAQDRQTDGIPSSALQGDPNILPDLLKYAYYGEAYEVKLLLQSGADINMVDSQGRTALHLAVENGHYPVVKILIDNHANVNAADVNGTTPLHLAACKGWYVPLLSDDQCIVSLLLNAPGININAVDSSGQTALCAAILNKQEETAEHLISRGADINFAVGGGWTPLHAAIMSGSDRMVDILLSNPWINVMAAPTAGKFVNVTPIFIASEKGNLGVVRKLINKGADVNAHASDEVTPIWWAMENDHYDVVCELVNNNANVTELYMEETPLWEMARHADYGDWCMMLAHTNIKDALDNYHANHPLFYSASCNEDPKVFDMFLDLYPEGATSNTLLRDVMFDRNIDAVKSLLKKGANVNAVDRNGDTLLHIALRRRSWEMIKVLLQDSRINVNAKNKSGETPLQRAVENRDLRSIEVLLQDDRVDVNTWTGDKWALVVPISRGRIDDIAFRIMDMLIQRGIDVNRISSEHPTSAAHNPPLIRFAYLGIDIAIDRLLQVPNIDVGAVDDLGCTFLHILAKDIHWSSRRIIEKWFEQDWFKENRNNIKGKIKRVFGIQDKNGSTPMDIVARMSDKKLINVFKRLREECDRT